MAYISKPYIMESIHGNKLYCSFSARQTLICRFLTLQQENSIAWKVKIDILNDWPWPSQLLLKTFQKLVSSIIGRSGWTWRKYCCTKRSKAGIVGISKHPRAFKNLMSSADSSEKSSNSIKWYSEYDRLAFNRACELLIPGTSARRSAWEFIWLAFSREVSSSEHISWCLH